MNKDLKRGDRVRLSPNTTWDTTLVSRSNPLDCLGTVTRVGRLIYIHVNWDNGTKNDYRGSDDDLILVETQSIDPSNISLSNIKW